ncbi:MAG: heavy-metal-associated domain-containing protein [Deltaproteobacteria bacterium]|nr:MAG: heavy-metal-associated domain-containing protein [Deltaproteobacteria bacterium]
MEQVCARDPGACQGFRVAHGPRRRTRRGRRAAERGRVLAHLRVRGGARSGAPPAELIACALVAAKRRERPSGAARALAALPAAIALVRLASPAGGLAAAESIPAASSAGTVAIPIEGMTCASCAAQVKKALRALDGVSDVEVSLEHRIARVRYTADKVKPEDLVGAIDRLGYKAGPPTLADDAP